MQQAAGPHGTEQTMLRNRNFLLLWLAQSVSRAGDTFTFLALAIRVDALFEQAGESARALGTILFAFALPQLLFGLFAGTLVDRWDRRRVMVGADLMRAALVPAFLLLRGPADLPWALAVAFAHSTASILFYPARGALLPALVESERLMKANGMLQVSDTAARLAGPILAGIVVGRWGTEPAFLLDSASFVGSAVLLLGISGVQTRSVREGAGGSAWRDLREGVRYAMASRLLQGVTLGLGLALLGVGGLDTLFVPYLRHGFQAPPEAVGAVMTAQGVGMLLGGLIIGRLGDRARPLAVSVAAMMVLGLGIAVLGAAPSYLWVLVASAVVGVSLPPVNAGLQTLLQQGVPSEMLGRAGSVVDTALTISQLTSVAGAGWVAASVGLRATFLVSAGLIGGGGLLMGWRLRGDVVQPRAAAASGPAS